MPSVTHGFSLRNYRCFGDAWTNPIYIEPGFTAIVGPNNSGKSSLLRLLDTRAHFFAIMAVNLRTDRVEATKRDEEAREPSEIFCKSTSGSLGIRFHHNEVSDDGFASSALIELEVTREPHFIRISNISGIETVRTSATQELFSSIDGIEAPLLNSNGQPAVRDKWGQIRQLFNHDRSTLIRLFASTLYIPATRASALKGAGQEFEIKIGQALVDQWKSLSTGSSNQQYQVSRQVEEDLADLLSLPSLSIQPHSDNTTLYFRVGRERYRVDEMGNGLLNCFVAILNAALKRPSLLLIDEPEQGLHPALQSKFLTSIARYATKSTVFSTHSLGLARSVTENIYSVVPDSRTRQSTIHRITDRPGLQESLGEQSFLLHKEMGYTTLLLIEGISDISIVKQWLRVLGMSNSIQVMSLSGTTYIDPRRREELKEFVGLSTAIAVIIDSERVSQESNIPTDRTEFAEVCRSLGFRTLITEWRATDNYLTQSCLEAAFGAEIKALSPFESAKARKGKDKWHKSEMWKAAAMMTSAEISSTDIGKFLLTLK